MTNLLTSVFDHDNGGFTGYNDRMYVPASLLNQTIPAGPGKITVSIQSSVTQNGTMDGLAIGTAGGIINTPSGVNFTGDQVQLFTAGQASNTWSGALIFTSDPASFFYGGPGTNLLVSTHWSGATDTGRANAPGGALTGCNAFLLGASQLMATNPTGVWGNDGNFTWIASIDWQPTIPSPGSDHASAELFPGGPSPGAQPPLAALASLFGVSLPILGTNLARRNLALLQPPTQTGKPPAMTQAVLAVPAGLTGLAANMLPVVPMRVLGMDSDQPDKGMWVIPVNLVGLKTTTVRVSYRDLHIEPGMRGLYIQYPTGGGPVLINCNAVGMTFTLGGGPFSGPLPLYMLEDGIDLTISSPNAFPPGTTCLLVQEKP